MPLNDPKRVDEVLVRVGREEPAEDEEREHLEDDQDEDDLGDPAQGEERTEADDDEHADSTGGQPGRAGDLPHCAVLAMLVAADVKAELLNAAPRLLSANGT